MDKQKKERLILLIAVVIFVIMIPQLVFKKKAEVALPYTAVKITPEPGAGKEQLPNTVSALPEDLILTERAPKNPFEIPNNVLEKLNAAKDKEMPEGSGGQSEEIPGIRLQGFVWGGDSPFAFINDKVYKKGDLVGDAQILDIDKNGVVFLYNGKTLSMRVKK